MTKNEASVLSVWGGFRSVGEITYYITGLSEADAREACGGLVRKGHARAELSSRKFEAIEGGRS